MSLPPPARRVYCNRTLNLRSIDVIGFDMDYTLVHYNTEVWEKRAYDTARGKLEILGWPVEDLEFDPSLASLGLILDLEHGNLVKADRFGYIKRASHGTHMLTFEELRRAYEQVIVDLGDPRWVFTNTLFGLSEGCLYAQAVDLLDEEALPGVMGYSDLYQIVRSQIDETHMEGTLKAEIMANPGPFVDLDEDMPLALMDLKHAGKKLVLITNSEWPYTQAMLAYTIDPFLPGDQTWRDLFDCKIVSASKPAFFHERRPVFEVVNEEGHLVPARNFHTGGVFLGGHAGLVEEHFQVPGENILYVGDHMFADVKVSKSKLRWRTALILRELEGELHALEQFKPKQLELSTMMDRKEQLEAQYSNLRLQIQRNKNAYGPQSDETVEVLEQQMQKCRVEVVALDQKIAPLARESAALSNHRWGLLMRAGNDKSHLARQIERYADTYTSRVSNLAHATPFSYFRSTRGSLPHDHGPAGGA